jgi:serine phosphatase RsbU (regulator of sigma subunit)
MEQSDLPALSQTPQDFASFGELLDYVDKVQQRLDGLTARLADLERQDGVLRTGLERLAGQVGQARRLQHDLLPTCLPDCGGLKVSKLYLPAHELSGDMYDVARVNDHQIVLNISDATGHGMAAALLNILVKQSLRAREHADAERQLTYPHELLQRLNEELLTISLSECQFITAIQAVYDEKDRTLLWARGGMPYPILIRKGQPPQHIMPFPHSSIWALK